MKNFPIVTRSKAAAIPLLALTEKQYEPWFKKQPAPVRQWLKDNRFIAAAGQHCAIPGKNGGIGRVVCGLGAEPDTWSVAHLPNLLDPAKTYRLEGDFKKGEATQLALGYALGCYQFSRYKKARPVPSLLLPKGADAIYIESMAQSICWARDMINTPANDMNPATLADEAASWGRKAGGQVRIIKGEQLLKENYPTIYTVGKASSVPPHLVDIRFAKKGAPKVTLVGKGVCFDSGGLDLKSSSNMRLMKKDMAGAAIVLALARTLRAAKVPVQLRVILPIVENAVSGNAMRPLDIVKTRKGITVEIGNTDAEGRLILCDALTEADDEKPDLLIDCSTLTGAARVALGTDMPAFFTPDDALADAVMKAGRAERDPLWRLPLHKPYRSFLDTQNAELSNDPDSGYGGAITAALYLQEFVSKTRSWLHLDMMAWNLSARPGRPQGGEAMAIRALHTLIKDKFG